MLQIIGYIFLFFSFLTAVSVYLLSKHLNSLKTVEPAAVSVLFESDSSSGFHFQVSRHETNEIPAGSVLVIPLIPIPIASKETVIRLFIEVLDTQKNVIWKSSDLKRLTTRPGQIQSVSEIDLSRQVENIFALEKKTADILGPPLFQELNISEHLPFDIQDLVQFIQQHQNQFTQHMGLPIGLIVQYAHAAPVSFKDKTSSATKPPFFSFSYMWLNFYYQTGDGDQMKRHQAKMKLKLDSKGLIDLSQTPDFSSKATDEEKEFVLKTAKKLDHYTDDQGVAFTDYIAKANKAFLNK